LGADRTVAILQAMLDLRDDPLAPTWRPPVLKTVAIAGQGTAEAVDAIERHVAYLAQSGRLRERLRARLANELQTLLREELLRRALAHIGSERYQALIERIISHETDPYSAARELLQEIQI